MDQVQSIIITDAKVLARKIGQIGRVGKTLQASIHVCAVSTLHHVQEHGDYTLAERLVNVMPQGQRVKALVYWYKHFSSGKFNLAFDKEAGTYKGKLSKERKAEDFDLFGSNETPFWALTEEKNPEALSVEKLMKYLEAKAKSEDPEKVTPEAAALADRLVKFIHESNHKAEEAAIRARIEAEAQNQAPTLEQAAAEAMQLAA